MWPDLRERIPKILRKNSTHFSLDDMNSVSRRRSRISLVAMIVGGLLAVAPVFGPLGKTLHYLADFMAERPQPMRAPDISFFVELLALIICPVGLLLFAISLVLFIRSGRGTAGRDKLVKREVVEAVTTFSLSHGRGQGPEG